MPNCSVCGQSVAAGLVAHRECLEEIVSNICDYYCKWPVVCEDKDRLIEKHCAKCPLDRLMEE